MINAIKTPNFCAPIDPDEKHTHTHTYTHTTSGKTVATTNSSISLQRNSPIEGLKVL